MSDVKFKDNTKEVIAALEQAARRGLMKAAGVITSQIQSIIPVDTGALKGSIQQTDPQIIGTKAEIAIGTPLMYGVYIEYGTGEFAENGQGRKNGWVYKDPKGKRHFTKGIRPHKTFKKAADAAGAKAIEAFVKELKR